jgi:hypothetical protein
MNESPTSEAQPRSLYWVGLYFLAWAVALLVTAQNRAALMVAWLFPIGLFGYFDLPSGEEGSTVSCFLAIGWLIYIVHAIAYFRARHPEAKFFLLLALGFILTFNVAGCRHRIAEGKQAGIIHFP